MSAPLTDPLWTSEEIAAATGGAAFGEAFAATGVAIDSRAIAAGDLFVALAGARDGHDFVPGAMAAGAAGALVRRPVGARGVVVGETLGGLTRLGEAARARASAALRVAVTGSVGKTSVTQMVRGALALAGDDHGSVKSFNNHIGVPLTLARMPRTTRRAVFEVGMNHADEITPLTRMIRPHAAAVTTVEPVHTENFADGEAGVARAKAEIFAGVEAGGAAILNADNRWFDFLAGEARRNGARVRRFGVAAGCEARLTGFTPRGGGAEVAAELDGRPIRYSLAQSAAHWGPMSLCALLLLQALDLDLDTSLAGLALFQPLEGRGAEHRVAAPGGSATLVDESYNASPVSVRAALAEFGARSAGGRKLLVLTDMLELGGAAAALHAGLAEAVERSGAAAVFCAGPLMRALFDALPPALRGAWAEEAEALMPDLIAAVRAGDVILVKGSNASGARRLAAALRDAAHASQAGGRPASPGGD